MTEQNNAFAELFAACWKDDALKARFMADPKDLAKVSQAGASIVVGAPKFKGGTGRVLALV